MYLLQLVRSTLRFKRFTTCEARGATSNGCLSARNPGQRRCSVFLTTDATQIGLQFDRRILCPVIGMLFAVQLSTLQWCLLLKRLHYVLETHRMHSAWGNRGGMPSSPGDAVVRTSAQACKNSRQVNTLFWASGSRIALSSWRVRGLAIFRLVHPDRSHIFWKWVGV